MDGLFVFDLDGTALGGGYEPYKRLPDPLCRFLDGLAGRHWKWAINTAWALNDQWKLVCKSPVSSRPLCLISEFGRRMATPNRQGGIDPIADYEAGHADLLERVCREKIRPLLARAMLDLPVIDMVYYGHLSSVRLYEDEKNERLLRAFLEPWQGDGDLELSLNAHGFSVRPSAIHKGLGVEGAARLFGIERERIVAAGDSLPDIAMMKAAGWAVCPKNADDCVIRFLSGNPHGAIGEGLCCDGVIGAFMTLAERNRWL